MPRLPRPATDPLSPARAFRPGPAGTHPSSRPAQPTSLLLCLLRLATAPFLSARAHRPVPPRRLSARPIRRPGLLLCLLLLATALPCAAEPLRLALWHTGLGRDGPGLLLRDIRRGAADVLAARDALLGLAPDAVLLLDIDHDRDALALSAFAALLAEAGLALPHTYAPRPNSGLATGLDLDGNGRRGEADDAQGWGRFAGAGGMALLSRWPIREDHDFTDFLWQDLPGTQLPMRDGQLFPSPGILARQRLSSTGHWQVRLNTPQGPLTLLAWHAGPPLFGGPHDRNALRNAAETAFWRWRLDTAPPETPFVLIGDANLDPGAGAGNRAEIAALLAHPLLQDLAPQATPPGTDTPPTATAHWPDGPGALRVDYLLPDRRLTVLQSGLVWPGPEATHAILWADLLMPD